MKRTLRIKNTACLLLALIFAGGVFAGVALASQQAAPRAGIKAPQLKRVPKVVRSTTHKKPPRKVRFTGQPMPGGVTTGTLSADGTGGVLISGVPGYGWRDGCGPTAVGMVIGYYDGHGYDQLIPGDATSDTAAVQQSIASHGVDGSSGHYEDYSLPYEETRTGVVPDRSEAPLGDEHVADSVADFMHTSWSADRLQYGFSFSNMVGSAFSGFFKLKYPGSSQVVTTYSGTALTWDIIKREVAADRPMVLLVDSSGDGVTDHFVTLVGYRESNGYAEYGCWDTWNRNLVRWQRFRGVSSSYTWGVWGGFTLHVAGGTEPAPEPTPTPTPTPTALPAADITTPVTFAQGIDGDWHNTAVSVSLSATDAESGVSFIEYRLDGYSWVRNASVTVTAQKGTAAVHTLEYRAVDIAGNVEAAQFAQVRIDTIKPSTTTNADGLSHPGSFNLQFTGKDNDSGVTGTYYSLDGRAYIQGTSVVISRAGRHTVKFYSRDAAGNQENTRSVTVKIS